MPTAASQQVTIANGGTTSGAFRTGPHTQALLIQFGTFTGATVTFTGADSENGTYVAVVGDTGSAISWTATDDKIVHGPAVEMAALLAVPYLKIVSAGAEAAERTLTVYMK